MSKHPWMVLETYGLQVVQNENPSGVYTLDERHENLAGAEQLAKLLNERDRYRAALEKILNYHLNRGDEASFYREYVRERAAEALKDE